MDKFADRGEAGIALASELNSYKDKSETIVLALPRGGVPVAYEISKALSLPFDIFIVRKLGVPGYEELAMGAIANDGTTLFNNEIINSFKLSKAQIQQVIQTEKIELKRRETLYRNDRPAPLLKNKTVILVDDGIATGATMLVALKSIKKQKPAQIIIAVPVAASTTCEAFIGKVDRFISLLKPVNFHAVGQWYEEFNQLSDEELITFMNKN